MTPSPHCNLAPSRGSVDHEGRGRAEVSERGERSRRQGRVEHVQLKQKGVKTAALDELMTAEL